MFAIPFGRMFWKEYRTNRAIWFACGLLGCLLQLILWTTLLNPYERTYYVNRMAAFVPVMYAIGCGAVMFAGEREERTSDWLLTLSVPKFPTLLAKASFAIVSTLVLQILMVICSIAFLAGSNVVETRSDSLNPMVPYGVATLVWTCLGSLVSRRVMNSIFTAAFWLFLPAILIQTIVDIVFSALSQKTVDPPSGHFWQITWWISGTITFAIDCGLGWKWCQGNYIDGTVLEKFLSGFSAISARLRRTSVDSNRIPLGSELEQPWRRAWQRLIWQERHRSRIPRALLLVGGALVILDIVLIMTVGALPAIRELIPFCLFMVCALTPAVMGLLSFQVDSSHQQSRFLANHGISWGTIWLAKQYVWLSRAVLIPLGLFCFSLLDSLVAGAVPLENLMPYLLGALLSLLLMFPPAIWFALLSYSGGQVASLLFRRTVLAAVSGTLFVLVLATWLLTIAICQLPLTGFMALPFVALMLITLWQMKPWLLEDRSWLRLGKLTASLISIPIILSLLLCGVRVGEAYFAPRVGEDTAKEFDRRVREVMEQRPDRELCKSVLAKLDDMVRKCDPAVTEPPQLILDEIEHNQPTLDSIETETLEEFQLLGQLSWSLEGEGRRLLKEGRLAESLKCYLASLKLNRARSHGGFSRWQQAYYDQRSTLESLITWANHHQQTADRVRDAAMQIAVELDLFPSFTSPLVKDYIDDLETWVLSPAIEVTRRLSQDEWSVNPLRSGVNALAAVPTERMRVRLLLTRRAEFNFESVILRENELKRLGFRAAIDRQSDYIATALRSLDQTTPELQFCGRHVRHSERLITGRCQTVRATLIRMHLIAYRLEHGHLPDRLVELTPEINSLDLIDPWSGQIFQYYPTFLFSRANTNDVLVPVNATELVLIQEEGAIQNRISIRLDESLKVDQDSDSPPELRNIGRLLFPIPAPLKRDSNEVLEIDGPR